MSYAINKTYFGLTNRRQMDVQSFHIFYYYNDLLDKAVNQRDNKIYNSGTAKYWIEHINIDVCSKAEFVFADELCCNATLFIKNNRVDENWFPQTYIYSRSNDSMMKTFSTKLKSKEHLDIAANIFGYTSMDEFVAKFIEVETAFHEGKLREYRYRSAFESAPVICEFVKSKELGMMN